MSIVVTCVIDLGFKEKPQIVFSERIDENGMDINVLGKYWDGHDGQSWLSI